MTFVNVSEGANEVTDGMVRPFNAPTGRGMRAYRESLFKLAVCLCWGLVLASHGAATAQDQEPPKPLDEAQARELGLTLSSTPEYTQGRYGTRRTTEILSVPFKLRWSVTDRLDLSVTVPYVWEHGPNIFATVGRVNRAPQRVNARRRPLRARVTTEDGLGDVLLDGSYVLLEAGDALPEVSGFADIKFPTADANKGLGTGEFDETIGLDVVKTFARWTTSLDASYTFVGSPPRIPLRNSFGWSAGLGYDATSSFRLSSYLEGATATAQHLRDPLDVRVVAEWKPGARVKLKAGVLKGLSSGSPSFGLLAGLEVGF